MGLVLVEAEHFYRVWSEYPLGLNRLGKWEDTISCQHMFVCSFIRVNGQKSKRRQEVAKHCVQKLGIASTKDGVWKITS